jgi:glutathione S-transferase
MITITALKWVPPFAQGNVRDHRVRWMLNEVGWSYRVRLLDTEDQQDPSYRLVQPFGQVPVMEETGRATLFETGFAALNSIEPTLMDLAEVDFFIEDERKKADRRRDVVKAVEFKLTQLTNALGSRHYLVGSAFTIADMMTSSVLKIVHHTDLLDNYPNLEAYCERCFARPAYQKAIADQCAEVARHQQKDMKYEQKKPA